MNLDICKKCNHYNKECNGRGRVAPEVNDSAEVIMLLPYPERADDDGKPYQGSKAKILRKMLEPYEGRYRFTYLMKCPTYQNKISRNGFKEPPKDAVKACLDHLYSELAQSPGATIMTFGSFPYKYLSGNYDVKISREYGTRRKVKFRDLEFDVMPNLDPNQVDKHEQHAKDMLLNLNKIFLSKDTPPLQIEDKCEILSPARAIKYIKTVVKLYKEGKIDSCVFDIENTISTDIIGGGEIHMVSITHDLSTKAVSIPFVVSNEIHHWKDHEDLDEYTADAFVEEYTKKYPHNAARIRTTPTGNNDQGLPKYTVSVPDLPFDVPPISFTVSPQEKAQIIAAIRELLETVPIDGHNLKYDLKWCTFLRYCDLSKVRIGVDTLNVAVQYQNIGPGIDNSLKGLARKFFNVNEDWEFEIEVYLQKFAKKKDRHYGQIPTSILGRYAALDVYYNRLLKKEFLVTVPENLLKMAAMITKAIIPMIEPETKGIMIAPETMTFLDAEYTKFMEKKRDEIEGLPTVKRFMAPYLAEHLQENAKKKKPLPMAEIHEKAFNFRYAAKVADVMFSKKFYGLPVSKEFKTDAGNPSTSKECREWLLKDVVDAQSLAEIENDKKDPVEGKRIATLYTEARGFVEKIHSYKRVAKLRDDYIRSFPDVMSGNMYYTNYNVNGTITGRMSSPFHSMPNGCDVKRVVVSRWRNIGGIILAADQSQLELRTVASLAGEDSLIKSFMAGVDAHTATACLIYQLPPDQITKKQRQVGKTVNFAILFGKTVYNLSRELLCTEREAQTIMDTFYRNAKKILAWKDKVQADTLASGYVDTVFGRRILIPNAFSHHENDREEAKRLAVNYRVQSPASDLVTSTVVDITHRMKVERTMQSILLAVVHDSTEFDIYPGELFTTAQILLEEAQNSIPTKFPWMTCPMHLDIELGASWGGAFKANIKDLDDNSMVFESEAPSMDIRYFIKDASKAYNLKCEVISREPVDPKSYPEDIFITSPETWKVRVSMNQKQ